MSGSAAVVERPDELSADVATAVHDLILSLADSKRLLGLRYADWTLGAPELEAGIACASMAQDEWGHARQLYALLRDFGDELEHVEHGREADDYACIEVLDQPPADWAALVVLNALVDSALSLQFEALLNSSYQPLRQRCEKLLDEERFHLAHGAAWFRRIAGSSDAARAALAAAVDAALPATMRWFGPQDASRTLLDAGVVEHGADELRCSYAGRVAAMLELVGRGDLSAAAPSFDDFDVTRRRNRGSAPDARSIEKVRGDRNRAFLMD